jgi:hypothetical protein
VASAALARDRPPFGFRMYVSGGDGAIGIFERKDPGTYEQIGEGATAEGDRTSLFVPETGKLHLAVPNYGAQQAEVRVYETTHGG